jgi:hypothetical protein
VAGLKQYPATDARATACALREPRQRAGNALRKFHRTRTNRLHASQNAALLLSDLGVVDIRRVGTQSKRILVVGYSE